MKLRIMMALLALMATPAIAAVSIAPIDADAWMQPRSGERILAMPQVQETVKRWQEDTERHIIVRYPGGEMGMLWAQEMRSWLVSLGIPGVSVEIQPGVSEDGVAMVLMLEQPQNN